MAYSSRHLAAGGRWLDIDGMKLWIRKVWSSRPGGLLRRRSLLVWDAFRAHLAEPVKRTLRQTNTDVAVTVTRDSVGCQKQGRRVLGVVGTTELIVPRGFEWLKFCSRPVAVNYINGACQN